MLRGASYGGELLDFCWIRVKYYGVKVNSKDNEGFEDFEGFERNFDTYNTITKLFINFCNICYTEVSGQWILYRRFC